MFFVYNYFLYVDDLITEAKTIVEGIQIREWVIKLLSLGDLIIRQCVSNDVSLLQGIAKSDINKNLQFSDDGALKILGVSWNSTRDQIVYSMRSPLSNPKITKRTILPDIFKLFNPLGLLGPVILFDKIFILSAKSGVAPIKLSALQN